MAAFPASPAAQAACGSCPFHSGHVIGLNPGRKQEQQLTLQMGLLWALLLCLGGFEFEPARNVIGEMKGAKTQQGRRHSSGRPKPRAVADHPFSSPLPKPAQLAAPQPGLAALAAGEVAPCWQATTFSYGKAEWEAVACLLGRFLLVAVAVLQLLLTMHVWSAHPMAGACSTLAVLAAVARETARWADLVPAIRVEAVLGPEQLPPNSCWPASWRQRLAPVPVGS